jgi:di/tricarboxylate transporter
MGRKVKEVYDCNIAWGGIWMLYWRCYISGTLLIFLCQDFEIIYPNAPEISFGQWLIFALPLSLIMFAVILAVLYIMFPPQKILRY